jgi:hypothetical protein
MRVSISVTNRQEGNMIVAGLADADTFALVKIMGVLSALDRAAQERVLWFVDSALRERRRQGPADKPADKGNGGEPLPA